MAEQNPESGRATAVEEEGPQAGNNDPQDLDSPPAKEGEAPVHRHRRGGCSYRGGAALLVAFHVLRRHR